MRESSAKNIGDYISEFEPNYQALLIQMWETISTAAPEAAEDIKYAMPTFVLNGNLVHFAAFKNHIGFYPTNSGVSEFKKELEGYQTSKGAIQFPHDQPLPLDLISDIAKFRFYEVQAKPVKKKKS